MLDLQLQSASDERDDLESEGRTTVYPDRKHALRKRLRIIWSLTVLLVSY